MWHIRDGSLARGLADALAFGPFQDHERLIPPMTVKQENTENASPNEAEQQASPSLEGYQAGENHGFCPQKELNLPASYEEVVARLKRLQGMRAMESLN